MTINIGSGIIRAGRAHAHLSDGGNCPPPEGS
jgi:hypothetical protein